MDLFAALSLLDPSQVEAWIEWGGYFVLFCLLFACGLGFPLPEDIPLLVAGFLIAHGEMDPVIACSMAWVGIIGGDCVLYSFGRRYGLNITRVPFVGKHVTAERILRAEALFDQWGVWVVGVGRMFAGVRGAMVVAAGAIRFNFLKFVITDGIAAIVSGGLFVALGYWAGRSLGTVEEMRTRIKGIEHYVIAIAAVLVLGIILIIIRRRRRHKPAIADLALERAVKKAHVDPRANDPNASPARE